MLLLNFAHPLTGDQLAQVSVLAGEQPTVRMIETQIDRRRPIAEVAVELADAVGLTPEEWQTLPLLINPPALAPLALTLMAELHGRCGYFLPVLNIRPAEGPLPRYEVAEIVNLQALRDTARVRR
jgi:hypothetical protein